MMAQIAMIPSVGDTMEQSTEDLVDAEVKNILSQEALEEGFWDILAHTPETKKWKKEHALDSLKQLWSSLPADSYETAMKCYVAWIYRQRNSQRSQLLFDLLEALVRDSAVSPKLICETLLNSESLDYNRGSVWCETFQLIKKVVGGVDYKGCRDLLRLILEKCQMIPHSENVATLPQIDAVISVVGYILDRNACLLPSYFAVNEISKVCTDDKSWPHWKMGRLLSDFIQRFRPAAQMVSIIGRSHLMPIVGHSLSTGNVWRLNQNTLKFNLSGPLPYNKEYQEPQTALLRYVLEQPYSRDMICSMLGLNKQAKQRCPVLEDQLVDMVVLAMERSEHDEITGDDDSQLLWQHISSQLIFFVLFQFASFPHMVMSLNEKLKGRNLKKGRNHLMWVLLQFISGSIQKNPLADFLPVMKLYDLLYSDSEVLPVPDVNKSVSTHDMAITCIWIHLNKKAQSDKVRLQRPIPTVLSEHIEFLSQNTALTMNDYRIALICNAYSTNTDYFNLPMSILVESINGNNKNKTLLPGGLEASAPTQPLPMSLLDSLTVHAKMSLIHSIVTKVIRLAGNRGSVALAPALVETYSRLLVYIEIESLGIKGFISQLLPNVFKSQAWGILHTLLEMFSYRLHHIQPHYRVQLLSYLHSLASVPHTNHNQLHLCMESTALRLITGLGSSEVQPQLSRNFNEPKCPSFVSQESEELNRALVLTLAQAMHVTGSETFTSNWCKDILVNIMHNTPHNWSSHTLQCFPPSLAEFFHKSALPKEDKSHLKRNVDTEYKKWKTMANESDIIAHFSMQGTQPLFLCILWKNLLDDNRIPPTAYKVLDRLGPRLLSLHLRTFADYLVQEFSSSAATQLVNRLVGALNDLVWKCNVVTIERLILCLALRNLEGNEAQVSFFIIQLLLIRPPDFKMRLTDFIRENSPEHWLQNNWHDKHMAFHRKYPENFYYEGSQDANSPNQHPYLPVYFGNVCLRFLPVLDIVIHRFLELPPVGKSLENILEHLGGLYKFHDRPITYLYNTLHYYERKLASRPALKRKLVHSITGALKDIRPANWCLSEEYQKYLQEPIEESKWMPTSEYYVKLLGRLVDTLSGKSPPPFPNCDWRFNEFPNPAAHALHATCVELMALPVNSQSVGSALLDVIFKCGTQLPRDKIMSWMNAVGLVLTALPDTYWQVLNERIVEVMQGQIFSQSMTNISPFQLFDFSVCHAVFAEMHLTYMLALLHAVWHHASIGQLTLIPQFMKEKLKSIIKTEEQFLYLCHLVGPFLQRFHAERTRCLLELTVELYEILEIVDRSCEHLRYIDPITDFLYHIKYIFVGDGVKSEVGKVIMNLRPALKYRLRFISHINVDEPLSA